jgi:hypothetical protein
LIEVTGLRIAALAAVAAVAIGCGPTTPSASPPPQGAATRVAAQGLLDCNGLGICGLRIAVFPGSGPASGAAAAVEVPMRAVTLVQLRPAADPVPVTLSLPGRHEVDVQVSFPSDVGTPAPPTWETICSTDLDLPPGAGNWLITVTLTEPLACVITGAHD